MIKLKDLGYSYKKGTDVLSGITMDFTPGKIYGILGKNGVGKSTLLKILCGLLSPQGECMIDGFNPFDRNAAFLKKITLVPETPFLEDMKVMQYAKIIAPFYPDFDFKLLED